MQSARSYAVSRPSILVQKLLSIEGGCYLQDWEGQVRAWLKIQSYRMGKFCFHWSYLSFSSFFSFDRGGIATIYISWVNFVRLSDSRGMLREMRVP